MTGWYVWCVQPSRDGGWDVIKAGYVRASVHVLTEAEAVAFAREVIEREGGGELQVKDEFGKLTGKEVWP